MKRVRARAFGLFLFVVAAVVAGLVGSPSVAYAPPGDPGNPYDRIVAEMLITGVTNDNVNPRWVDAMDLLSFAWGSSQTATIPKADPVVVVKPIDASTPQLYARHVNGTLLKSVLINVFRITPEGGPQLYLAYCFSGALITSIKPFDQGISDDEIAFDDKMLEEVTITARRVTETYYTENESYGWDYRIGAPWTGHC